MSTTKPEPSDRSSWRWGKNWLPKNGSAGTVDGRPVRIVSFYDPHLPAWFVLSIEPGMGRLLALRMTAQAHFMQHRYTGFDKPLKIVPPAATHP